MTIFRFFAILLPFIISVTALPAQPVNDPDLIFHCYTKNGKKLVFETHGESEDDFVIKTEKGAYRLIVTYFSDQGEKPDLLGGISSYYGKGEHTVALLKGYPNVRLQMKHCRRLMTIDFLNLDHPLLDYKLEKIVFRPGKFTVDARDFVKPDQEDYPVELQLDTSSKIKTKKRSGTKPE